MGLTSEFNGLICLNMDKVHLSLIFSDNFVITNKLDDQINLIKNNRIYV